MVFGAEGTGAEPLAYQLAAFVGPLNRGLEDYQAAYEAEVDSTAPGTGSSVGIGVARDSGDSGAGETDTSCLLLMTVFAYTVTAQRRTLPGSVNHSAKESEAVAEDEAGLKRALYLGMKLAIRSGRRFGGHPAHGPALVARPARSAVHGHSLPRPAGEEEDGLEGPAPPASWSSPLQLRC